MTYMAAFEEDKELVIYCYEIKERFIDDIYKRRFEGKRVVRTGLKEHEISDICNRRGLSAKFVKVI